jgi:hypothetical protein
VTHLRASLDKAKFYPSGAISRSALIFVVEARQKAEGRRQKAEGRRQKE